MRKIISVRSKLVTATCISVTALAVAFISSQILLPPLGVLADSGQGRGAFVAPGDLDSTFGNAGVVLASVSDGAMDDGQVIATQPDGKVIAAGVTRVGSANADFGIIRLNSDGTLDNTFGVGGRAIVDFNGQADIVRAISIQSDGKIIIGGYTGSTDTNIYALALVRLHTNGSPDTTFGSGGKVTTSVGPISHIYGLTLQSDGKIVAVGDTVNAGNSDLVLARYNTDGALDSTFGTGGIVISVTTGSEVLTGATVQPDGKIVAVGYGWPTAPPPDAVILRFNSSGTIDTNFGTGGRRSIDLGGADDLFRDVKVDDQGRIIAGGFSRIGGVLHTALIRFLSNGTFDNSFGTNGVVATNTGNSSRGESVVRQNDNKIVVIGTAALVRYDQNGSLDTTFGNNGIVIAPAGSIRKGTIDNAGKILTVGTLSTSGNDDIIIARFLGDTVTPTSGASFDFDGDGKTDVSIFRPGAGEWWYLRSSDGGNRAFQFGAATDTIVPADYTGDGKADVAFWRPSTGEWYILRSEDGTFYAFPFGSSGDVPAPADFDGDAKDDAAVFRPSSGTWFINRSSDGQTSIVPFGTPGDRAVPADYDGDGKGDVAIFRPAGSSGGGEWWYLRSSDGASRAFAFGSANDSTVAADYTGDGKADIAFFRPTSGEWFVLRSEDSSFYSFPWGTNGDVASPGDYDGDGKTDATVFRPSSNTWYSFRSSTSGTVITPFGAAGDKAVPSAYVR